MSISRLFEQLGAPLTNTRWSWRAVRPANGAVLLRVWQDLKFIEDGRVHAEVDSNRAPSAASSRHEEHRRHIELICNGARCY